MRQLILATAASAAALGAALSADVSAVYAIRGAQIVTASNATIQRGTVVLRRGVIEEVGDSVAVPSNAVVIDGRGLTLYPGLIDLGAVGITDAAASQPLRNPRTTAQIERWKRQQLLRPHAAAAELV